MTRRSFFRSFREPKPMENLGVVLYDRLVDWVREWNAMAPGTRSVGEQKAWRRVEAAFEDLKYSREEILKK